MTTIQATPLQRQMIAAVALSEYSTLNGGVPSCLDDIGPIWANTVIY